MTTKVDITSGDYRPVGISLLGGTCDACHTEAPKRLWIVENHATGQRLQLGTKCAENATGLTARLLAERAQWAADQEAARTEPVVIGEMPDWMLGDVL